MPRTTGLVFALWLLEAGAVSGPVTMEDMGIASHEELVLENRQPEQTVTPHKSTDQTAKPPKHTITDKLPDNEPGFSQETLNRLAAQGVKHNRRLTKNKNSNEPGPRPGRERGHGPADLSADDLNNLASNSANAARQFMAFVDIDYNGAKTKEQADRIASRWTSLCSAAGIKISVYTIDERKLLISTSTSSPSEIRDFAVAQAETVNFVHKGAKTKGPAWSVEWEEESQARSAAKKKSHKEGIGAASGGEGKRRRKGERRARRKDEV